MKGVVMLFGKTINIIFASGLRNGDGLLIIGKEGKLPWDRHEIPSDLARFRKLTYGCSVIMGRKTWDSLELPNKPLPGRQNIVITRKPEDIRSQGVATAGNFKDAVRLAKNDIVWIIGGAEIYRLALPYADFVHWTLIRERYDGDIFFPRLSKKEWEEESELTRYLYRGIGEAALDSVDSLYVVLRNVSSSTK